MDVCRREFAGLLSLALMSEPDEWEFTYAKETGASTSEVEWWQTAFVTNTDTACSALSKAEKVAAGAACGYIAEAAMVKTNGFVQGGDDNTPAFYYARGYGPLRPQGAQEYSEFSKAMFGNEWALGDAPDRVATEKFLGIATIFWRYMQYYNSHLPSVHDVMTGSWSPSGAEAAAGLKAQDFCTVHQLVEMQKELRDGNSYA